MKNTEYKNFEHALKPYYNYTEKEEKEYSYFTDSLYLLNPTRALELFRLGLPVYMLNANGWQSKVRDAAQLIEGGYARDFCIPIKAKYSCERGARQRILPGI